MARALNALAGDLCTTPFGLVGEVAFAHVIERLRAESGGVVAEAVQRAFDQFPVTAAGCCAKLRRAVIQDPLDVPSGGAGDPGA